MSTYSLISRIDRMSNSISTGKHILDNTGDVGNFLKRYEFLQLESDIDVLKKIIPALQKDVSRAIKARDYELTRNASIHKELKIYEDRMKDHGITG